MFIWNMEDVKVAVERARQGKEGKVKFPAHFSLIQCIEAMPFSFWQGKVRRIYIDPDPQYTNLLKWYADWVEGPKGRDDTTQSRVIRNMKAFNISFVGVLYLAKMGHLTGTCTLALSCSSMLFVCIVHASCFTCGVVLQPCTIMYV
jgi:hypothetical protein